MASSKIIKELISNQISINDALNRLLLISMELNDKDTIEWIESEKNGYKDDFVPEYRTVKAYFIGDYDIEGAGHIIHNKNQVLPTLGVSKDLKEKLEHWNVRDSITILCGQKKDYEENKRSGIPIHPEHFFMFEQDTNIHVTSAFIIVPELSIDNILDKVKTKILKILIILEKNFGNLDNFDIDIFDYDENELNNLRKVIGANLKGDSINDIYIINSKFNKSNIGAGNIVKKESSTPITTKLNINKNENKESLIKKVIKRIFKKNNK